MLFYIDIDTGEAISGWLIPDNPGDIPEFVLRAPDCQDLFLRANVLRQDLRDLGLHSSGLAGFHFDSRIAPYLSELSDLSIYEMSTGLLIYRRITETRHLAKKAMFADASAFPQGKLFRSFLSRFSYSYPIAERFSLETLNTIINMNHARSIFMCGQLNWNRFGPALKEQSFFTAALLRDPFEELAEKLLMLRYILKSPRATKVGAIADRFGPLMSLAEGIEPGDRKSVLASFRKITPDARKLLRSPMVSLFGSTPNEELQRRNVSLALDSLSYFDVVGIRDRFAEYRYMVNQFLGDDVMSNANPEVISGTSELAGIFSEVGLVSDLLDEDLALYSFAKEAVATGLEAGATGQPALTGAGRANV
ncbi:hypothetical protein IB267_32050 [Ensifer sp. ENS09]|uniref:hypothetical protein n=1 Tax=Ensifer sp. ENS09 TaxID=2769263 RepID=UPI00177EB22B|nr:hypothetical protein [Ensifer sp. ENS09]MBD9653001.1 hypothetical protein [Ensifer sp. ENS09]